MKILITLGAQLKSDFATLAFYASCPGWHSYNPLDENTLESISTLCHEGYLERSSFSHQARFTGKKFVDQSR
jgi:hypothetical protein